MAKKKTSKDVSPATRTRMQELGSAWVFKRAIQDNAKFNKVEDIKMGGHPHCLRCADHTKENRDYCDNCEEGD